MKYVVLICARNEEKYIASCLASVYFQTHAPEMVVVVDDGSTDETFNRAREFHERLPITILHKEDRGFSATGTALMADTYNLGLDYLSSFKWDFILILGADTSIPPNYVNFLWQSMNSKKGAVSGRYPFTSEKYAAASGRFIRREIIEELGGRLPETYAWESSIIYCSEYMGYENRSFPMPIYNLRPGGHGKRSGIGLGRGVKEIGYYWPNVIYKAFLEAYKGNIKVALEIIYGYFIHKPQTPLPEWAQFINEQQRKSFKQKFRRIIQWY